MKNTMLFLLIAACGSTAFAQSQEKLYGYLNESRSGEVFFVAVNEDFSGNTSNSDPLKSLIPADRLSDSELTIMMACMNKRETNVIAVVRETKRVPVPTDIPGRTTMATTFAIKSIACERRPGFIKVWRSLVSQSAFR